MYIYVYIAELRQRYDIALNSFFWHVPNDAIKDL